VALVGLLAVIVAAGTTAYALDRENHDAFCPSCHTQPEAQYYQQSLEQHQTTLAAFHTHEGVRCIDCHSGGGTFGRAKGLTQGAQDLLAYYRGNYHDPAISTSKLSDDSCIKCHADVTSGRNFNNHFHIFLSRWQAVDPNAARCADCHLSHPAANSAQTYLVETTVTAVCRDCHAAIGER
jgi:predicted CXXCH cytochrome family protein